MKLKRILCFFINHKFRTVLFGYPKNQFYWQEVSFCSRCKKWQVVQDEIFAETRPYNLPMDEDWMALEASIRAKKFKTQKT